MGGTSPVNHRKLSQILAPRFGGLDADRLHTPFIAGGGVEAILFSSHGKKVVSLRSIIQSQIAPKP
jgi:hypothetical protein